MPDGATNCSQTTLTLLTPSHETGHRRTVTPEKSLLNPSDQGM